MKMDTVTEAENLLRLIKRMLLERDYDGVKMLFQSPTVFAEIEPHMAAIAMELYNEICAPTLTDDTNVDDAPLFDCVNELLKIVARYASLHPFMLELMEKIEESSSIAIFSAYLRALQVVLLRQGSAKPQAIEWCLSSVVTRIRELPLPDYLSEGYDEQQAHLLEQEQQIEQLMAHYITIDLCYEPLLKAVLQQDARAPIFRDCGLNRRNVLTCFLLQLLGKPLALLEVSNVPKRLLQPGQAHTCTPSPWRLRPELTQQNYLLARANAGKTQTYVQQVQHTLTSDITRLLGDPYYLLGLVEQRARWKRRLDAANGVYEMSSHNMFLIDDKLPLPALAMYYHALLVGQLLPATAPKIYAPLFLFESSLYLVAVLLEQPEPPLQHCGLRLNDYMLSILTEAVPQRSLDLEVHKRYCEALCKITGYSPQEPLRQLGLQVLHHYILAFEDAAKYFILKNLLETLQHDGILGYLAGMYKDLVAAALEKKAPLSDVYSGIKFRSMLLRCVCVLPQDVKSDLLLHSVSLSNALNILRYFAMADLENRTGFWHALPEIEERLLQPLGKALNFSLAHYKAYRERVRNGQSASDDELMQKQLNMLAVNISNSGMGGEGEGDGNLPDIGREEKLEVLAGSITGLESLRVLYLLASDNLEQSIARRKQATATNTTTPTAMELELEQR
ncbi:uncharacterized protein [Drosophila virilis]|uniref:Glomulin n=1 Tax=Drosophila virilis TaxID=7244 RepID=B4LJH6_DROVI|nr:uncharacterized protein LOC6626350 [Drosophila virilis]EDW61544.2 uncharacterized protein Dvir_GJ22110 [Drosophila virilis]